jgi:hypothetical protein
MLFGENVDGGNNKKRDAKVANKEYGNMSVVSKKTSKSKNYHKQMECDLCGK